MTLTKLHINGLGKLRSYYVRVRYDRWMRSHKHGWAGHTRNANGRRRLSGR